VCTSEAGASDAEGLGLRPVLMDFGLARDALGPQRLTQTGVIMGTPHYMAPEQARGRARHLDRRADVYSLGAVLHELLAGKPPFDAENEVELLLAVLNQEPPPLRQLEPSIPLDLEVIVLKCLQKEPAQRYESALALAEDLGRYLRGEPIIARPASTLYRLRRLAQRHRAWVAVATLLLASLLFFLLLMVRSRQEQRAAAERAKAKEQLVTQLAQTVTELRLFLRVAYSLPPHDLRREQQLIKARLAQLEQQLQSSEASLKGAIEGALGQGYLVLGESALAQRHLEQALQLGNDLQSVHLALGEALGRIFEQKRDELRRTAAEDQLKPQIDALRRKYVARVRQELYKGGEAAAGSAGFVEALLRFYESDSPEALGKALAGARQAQQDTPWLLEPFDLEVKIRIEQLSAQLSRGQLEGKQQVAEVQATLARALDLARSYPSFYMSNNQFSLTMLRLALFSGMPPKEVESIYNLGVERAKVAITLLPDCGEAHDQLARLYSYWAYLKTENSQEVGDLLQEGLKVITLADKLPPERAEHYFVRGRLLDALALEKWHEGASDLPELPQSIADIRKASNLDPGNVDYLNTLAVLTSLLAKWRQEHGGDSISMIKEAIATVERARALRPQLAIVRSNLAALRLDLALDYIDHGIDPKSELRLALDELQAALAINPKLAAARDTELVATLVQLRQQLEAGQDITTQTVELGQRHRQMVQESPSRRQLWDGLLKNDLLYGEALLRQGRSPEPAIAAGLADLQAGVRAASLLLGTQAEFRGQLLLLRARWLLRTGKSPLPVVAALAALPQVTPGPQCAGKLASIALNRAQLWRLVADWQSSHGQPAAEAIAQGLAAVAESDRLAGGVLTRAQAERGALLALKAQALGEPSARKQTATEATALLQAALHDSPPLAWHYRSYLQAVAPQPSSAP
jgi:serine/threonine-protein kinase